MISFPQALNLLLERTPQLAVESCRIGQAAGRVLRREIRADRPFPPFDRVMMDGFALRSADLLTNRTFRITGSAPAGRAAVALSETCGSCVEVMTGAPLPPGADCIVPVEETSRPGADEITIAASFEAVAGRFIHKAGSDAAEGAILLKPGTLLGSREIGVAASCGAGLIEVSRLPEISVIATGDELVSVDETPAAHQIRQSNAHAIASALRRGGFPAGHVGTLGDDEPAAMEILRERLGAGDWLVLTGAVSRGARDFIPAMLDSLGCTRLFHGVAQRPGKPAGCWIGPAGQMVMALPGNPVSALTGLHAFVLPALAVGSGLPVPKPRMVIPQGRVEVLAGMTHHLPVILGDDGRASPAASGNSGDFIGLLRSDGFITLPPRGGINAAFPFTPWL
jgi:molybdopterin molybdotransferase